MPQKPESTNRVRKICFKVWEKLKITLMEKQKH
jgi:hypothetical protein